MHENYVVYPNWMGEGKWALCKFADNKPVGALLLSRITRNTLQEIADHIERHLPGIEVRWHINQPFIL